MAQTRKTLGRMDRPGMPGWIVCDPRDGQAVAWMPFEWLARLITSRRRHLDYVRCGEGW